MYFIHKKIIKKKTNYVAVKFSKPREISINKNNYSVKRLNIYDAILKDEVAAGLGAFKTEIKLPLILISKSCSNEPLGFINCALTPAGEDVIISSLISGINFCRSFRNIDLKIDISNYL